jgi:predicted extracellular nuclease
VTGDFQAWYELSGFFMQDLNGDGNPATSDGVFVYERYDAVSVGDHVRVTGNVDEYYDLTEITSVDLVQICGAGVVPPAEVSLPLGSVDEWEQYEGMLVHIPQTLTATDNYNQGLYGEVTLSAGGRLYNPTGVVAPGSEANALQDLNNRRQIQLEDGSTRRNPSPVPYVGEGGTLRAGDTIPDLTGVVHYNFETYEIHPTSPVTFTRVNARQESPSETGGGVEVASFNVLNYFTTIDDSGPICGPSADMDCRGADTAEEFTRQRDKIISAIAAMDAEVVGLMELENHPTDAALQDLVNGLNDAAGAGAYSYIPTGPVGTDAIKVAFIYQTAAVQPVGGFAILDSSVDPAFLDTKNRPALAQTFEEIATGARFTAVVNHLKSKGSDCNDVGDPDTGDGQGNCNLTRTQAAEALVNWLSTDPTRMGDPDSIIIGDLNSYAMEDPVGVIQDAGYTNLVEAYGGAGAYSYIYFGQAGYLDHALSNSSLTGQVQGAEVWHINSDEPYALDYNDYNQPELYQPGPYRSSDHDPVMVGLDLVNQPPVCSGAYPGVDTIWPANHKFVPVEILGVYDPDGNGFAISIDAIYQDEPVDSTGDGAFVPDGLGLGMPRAVVRAERDGAGNGRVYHIFFTAEDHGNTCKGEVTVGVPKSQKTGSTPIDEGALYDSFFLE